ncbi:MAG TPA: PAS domain S-box protein [Rhodocyclaceae bacterium]|nr:PAS domain S-box protein [Rhodocyclaceae bacterium]
MKTSDRYEKQDNDESSHRGAAQPQGKLPDSPNDGGKSGLDVTAMQQHLADILELSADFIGSARVEDGSLLYHNRAARRMIGLPEDADLSGMTVADMHPAWAAKQVLEVAIPSLLEHGVWSGESALLHRDGREIPVHQTLALHRDADGKPLYHSTIMKDITERKRFEAKLAERERDFRSLAENLPDNIARFGLDGRYLYINRTHEHTLGKSREQIIGTTIPDSHTSVKSAIARVATTGQAIQSVRQPVEVDGIVQLHDVSLVPEFDETGKVVSVLGIGREMTEFYRLQDSLAVREQEFRSLAENLPDPVFRYNRECRRIYVNPAVRELTGISPEALLGKTPTEMPVVGVAERSRIQAALEHVIASGEKDDVEVRMIAANGRERWYRMVQVPEFAPDGSVRGVLSIGRDETKLHQLESELRRRAALEEQVSSLAQAAPGFLFLGRTEPDGRAHFPFASDGVVELFGLRPEDIRDDAEVLRALYHPDDRIRLLECTAESALNLTPYHIEIRIRHPEKGERWIEIRGTPRRKDDGATEWHGLMFDITERKQDEAELHAQYEQILLLNERLEENARSLEEQAVELEASQEQLKFTEAWYRGILHSAPDGMMVINERSRVTQVNAQLARMFGYSEGELIGQPMAMLIPPDAGGEALDLPDERISQAAGELRGRRQDGSEIAIEVTFSRLPEADMAGTICVAIRDITERKRMLAALAEREREFRTLVENSPDTVARYGRDLTRQYVNPAFASLVEGGVAALIGRKPTECPGGPNTALYEQNIAAVFETAQAKEFELKWADKTGREFCSLINLTPELGEDGAVQSVLAVGRDISELNVFRQKIHQMAFYDPLTALPNRALFNDRLHQMITDASWHGQLAGVMMIDMDRFKAVNDTMGHAVGDELLRETATRLGDCVRAYDTVARLGGDEFAILLPEIRHSDDLGRIANKVLAKFDERFLLEGKEIFVSCSIGIALYPNDSADANDLVKFADSAMYFAKRSGRNNFRFYSKDLTASANERLTLESELRRAVERQELELHYQPKVSLHDGMMIGSEALLRWRHPRLGMVPPNQFIQIAEDTGLIIDLGKWVLREACRTASEWNAGDGPRHKMAINLSARQFQSHDLTATVAEVLAETACRPEWVELEITESLLLDSAGQTLDILLALRAMGITIAIDDFGTGYSALSYLTSFPIDTLKIDRSFIHSVATDNYRAELVKAILSIARCLGQQVVAEGVETPEQAVFLQAHGCQVVQGFLYSRPLPKHEVAALPRHFDCGKGSP